MLLVDSLNFSQYLFFATPFYILDLLEFCGDGLEIKFLYNLHLQYVSGAVYVLLQCVSAQFNILFSTSAELRGSNNGGNARTLPSQQRRAETLAYH